jgi:hypothetical protein
MKNYLFFYLFFIFLISTLFAQNTGNIQGTVRDKDSQELLIGVSITLEGTEPVIGATTDENGFFTLTAPAGSYNIKATYTGYKDLVKFNIVLTSGNASILNFELENENKELEEVTIIANKKASASTATLVSPLSVQKLTTEEIRSNPGGNFDISRVIQALPGVAGTAGGGGFRNDIIIRGGAPNENVYYLDGIEIPVINHFSTQGSAGGPVGILNVSFIEDVQLNSSAFDARFDNALASVFQFKQREGNQQRLQGNVRLSGTELAATFEGPINKKTNYLVSARRSYLSLLFSALDLPIRPDYWDFQYKVTHKIDKKTTLTFLGVGAIDEFSFGVPRKSTPENEYTLRSTPSIQQWNYTFGVSLKRLLNNGFMNIALSRNMFDNDLDRFEDRQIGDESRRALRLRSQEIENKLRIDVNKTYGKWKVAYGAMAQFVKFNNEIFSVIRKELRDNSNQIIQPAVSINFNSGIDFFRYGAFGQVSRSFFKDRLGVSFGLRTDMNSFINDGNNPLNTLSPRLSLSYIISDQWTINASVGDYYKLPIYTILGYKDTQGNFVNKDNKYLRSTHYVIGAEYLPRESTRFTFEAFYKQYDNYAVSVRDGISLANQGGGFGFIGNERTVSVGNGQAYGFEFFFQQKLVKNTFVTFSYTYVISEFAGLDGKMIASAWDNRHLISGILGRKLGRGWELGLKYRFAGGSPYTPFDLVASQRNYLATGQGVLDNSRLNSLRLDNFNQMDIRIDKKWNKKNFTFDLFIDISNVLASNNPAFPQYTFVRNADNTGFATTDGQPLQPDGSNAKPLILNNRSNTVLPTIGFIVEF